MEWVCGAQNCGLAAKFDGPSPQLRLGDTRVLPEDQEEPVHLVYGLALAMMRRLLVMMELQT